MATLEKLRNKAGFILIAFIGLALLSFILSDIFSSPQGGGGSLFGGNQYEIAKIGRESVHIQEYQELIDNLEDNQRRNTGRSGIDEQSRVEIRENAWDMLVQQHIMNSTYEELGISVSGEELFDLIQGEDPHPIIKNNFTNPETGELNRTQLLRFLKSMAEGGNPEQQQMWLPIEKQIYRQQKMSKYLTLIRKGLYISPLETDDYVSKNNTRFDISYVLSRYNEVPDTAINITEKEIKAYYKEHKNQYKQDASRTLEYVAFEVVPSPDDIQAAKDWIHDIAPDFEEAEEVGQFVNLNSDVPFDRKNYARGELPEVLDSALFDAPVGTTYGPYREDEAFKMAKLADINYVPDSVRARHILIQPNEQMDYSAAQSLADSLLQQVKAGADFAQLARSNSADRGSAQQGGNLGWFTEGTMVAPINDTAFYGNTGDIALINTEFGIHILEILEQSEKRKKVQVGILVRNIEPSDVTFEKYYQQASKFAGANRTYEAFKKAAEAQGMNIRTASGLQKMTHRVNDLQSPREMVKWAFEEASEHEVSGVFDLGDDFVVAALTDIKKEGSASLEEVRSEIEFELKKELKAKKLQSELEKTVASSSSLSDIANKHNLTVQNASGVSGASSNLEGAGREPEVIAVASVMEENTISQPIAGTNGVYVITINNKEEIPENPNIVRQQKLTLQQGYARRASYDAYEALKEHVEIEDKRSKFY